MNERPAFAFGNMLGHPERFRAIWCQQDLGGGYAACAVVSIHFPKAGDRSACLERSRPLHQLQLHYHLRIGRDPLPDLLPIPIEDWGA